MSFRAQAGDAGIEMKSAPVGTEKARNAILMRINLVLLVCAAITVPQLTMAQLPFSNDEFGKVERTLSFCSDLKPDSAAKYQEMAKRYVGNASEQELAEARKTPEYIDAYESNGAMLADMPKEHVIEACNAFLKAKDLR
jgi:hypothetical protein